jgi:hypothetical protein
MCLVGRPELESGHVVGLESHWQADWWLPRQRLETQGQCLSRLTQALAHEYTAVETALDAGVCVQRAAPEFGVIIKKRHKYWWMRL